MNGALASGCRYAIPFASIPYHLHKDVVHVNTMVTTPQQVVDSCRMRRITAPESMVMV